MNQRTDNNTMIPKYDANALAEALKNYNKSAVQEEKSGSKDAPPAVSAPSSAVKAPGVLHESGKKRNTSPPSFVPESAETIAERSRRLVMRSLGKTIRQYQSGKDSSSGFPVPETGNSDSASASSSQKKNVSPASDAPAENKKPVNSFA